MRSQLSIDIPAWTQPADIQPGAGWSEDDTPRDSPASPGSLPSSPTARKTKSRALRGLRTNSLKEPKVLLVSDMHRTESAMDPSLFQYHQHFEAPWQLVGKTHLSEVFRVRHCATGEVFAVKRSRRRFRSKLQRERCLREIRAVAALPTHPNIVNQYRAWQEGGHFHIQMDFCEGGSLAHQAHKASVQGGCMSDEQLWTAACQAAHGLLFLHSHGVLHLDVKPDNIYLSKGTWRIGDFGLAVARYQDGSTVGLLRQDWEEGDGDYVAPELLARGGEPSPASDVFSLGATLYECATGHKLARPEGWTAADLEALQVPGRPLALVQLLRGMLQPSPGARPSAQQVLDVVAQEQPDVARQAAAAVTASICAAPEASGHPATQEASLPQAAAALAPSPFMQLAHQGGSPSEHAHVPPLPLTARPSGFSFDVSQARASSFAFTPSQPLLTLNQQRLRNSSSCGDKGIAKTPAPRARIGTRWAPALSPLISEGALTPGAAAALAGLTPMQHGSRQGAATPTLFQGAGNPQLTSTPLDMCRPSPLQLPPQTVAATGTTGGSSGLPSAQHPSSSGTQGSREGWRLRRRDLVSPDSDALAASHSDSDYSYSCGTGRTHSDMDFADALSPMSAELVHGAARGTPSTGTPDSLLHHRWLERQSACSGTPGTDEQHMGPASDAGAWPGALAAHIRQVAPTLALDLHTSPDFLMQLPPGSPESLSRASSLDDSASLPSRALSIRRFPTLDSWGSQPHLEGGPISKAPSRADSLAALAAQRFTHSVAPAAAQGVAPASMAANATACHPPARGLRKRQHSSRRTLMAALSRDNSVASSIDGMQPQGKTRHIMAPDSGPASLDSSGELPVAPRLLHRASSILGRELPATAVGLAEAAVKALAAGSMPLEDARAAVAAAAGPCPSFCAEGRFSSPGNALPEPASPVLLRPTQSPLHARMTCMKLGDNE